MTGCENLHQIKLWYDDLVFIGTSNLYLYLGVKTNHMRNNIEVKISYRPKTWKLRFGKLSIIGGNPTSTYFIVKWKDSCLLCLQLPTTSEQK